MLPFTGNPLDRRSDKRGDTDWLAEQRRVARILPLWRLNALVTGTPLLSASVVPHDVAEALGGADAVSVFLGLDGETPLFALDVSGHAEAPEALKSYGEFLELRAAAPSLRRKDLAILSQAKAMLDWHSRHRFCARCGAATVSGDAGYKRSCPRCQAEHFPRTDPAV
ncbi:MAG: NUDIX-like domain-containing protein, partial [Rhizomicrobium sp.]|nr:NUDIX-like domain-containing protein [Rhizomicrobium sp.]